ncbi:MAG: glycine cleavage system protein H [Deltaproteobacteria bacterium RIFCSPLOWO2_12_55_13]|nr:MAG: glycine cleavage system protein H [Deltaproteobacteria bacterium GWD2_55_8]OGQ65207.1 MAG: glycine cleavage system protein H [Deltaproteobacteria bacterium RIFCSPLOWO2_12_55_13]OGQ94800.1 MAG: glycine cleavage system protein H [Deltaproteobacteria bacterium RIFOXYA2_FULL_55_11]HBA39748.1 glycine cleavage system protein GcvH [Deltaproteobacteria bacterium]
MERMLKVSQEHVWIGIEDQHVFFGLTNYGQSELGQIISVDLPEVGDKVERGEPFGEVESTSTVSELIAPVSGTVLAINPELENHPAVINEDPYSEGWMIEVRLKDDSEIKSLMDMDEYYHFVFPDRQ